MISALDASQTVSSRCTLIHRDSAPLPADIQFDQDPPFVFSGDGKFLTSDDEDYGVSGSGSGSGLGMYDQDLEVDDVYKGHSKMYATTTTTSTTTTPVITRETSACERQRVEAQVRLTNYVPKCNENGDFEALQCNGHPGTADCFCVDLHGKPIPGTHMERPNFPSCEEGYNLPNCTHQMVKSARLFGQQRPRCTAEGLYMRIQCSGSICSCVDPYSGQKISGTETHLPDKPKCGDGMDDRHLERTTRPLRPDLKIPYGRPSYPDSSDEDVDFVEDDNGTIDVDQNGELDSTSEDDGDDSDDYLPDNKFAGLDTDERDDPDSSDEDNVGKGGNQDSSYGQKDRVEKASEILTQPGILAGMIGGAVVLLLCLVLLIMFVVYRMRKKDEGSYPLDEPRRGPPNYSYVRAPDKEYYA
ncbi:hypothetical protein RRG08_012093 [Elysia crispata]|uniref:Syndecan n=1 Tax=Elysia crispata TaxID=231223 RepID=A0AAE1D4I1_9GAST|nr:hypothetical protein RRG08_012093 [Elysia crispata]